MHTSDSSPSHAQAVLRMLSLQRQVGNVQGAWPFGVELTLAWGRFDIGQRVLTPGIDDCSPKVVAEVLRTGTRPDQPGIWCLLRHQGQALPSVLIREDALSAVDDTEFSDTEHDGLTTGSLASRRTGGNEFSQAWLQGRSARVVPSIRE